MDTTTPRILSTHAVGKFHVEHFQTRFGDRVWFVCSADGVGVHIQGTLAEAVAFLRVEL